jgi:hypothetical protein
MDVKNAKSDLQTKKIYIKNVAFVLVIAYYRLTEHLSVYSIGMCLVISFAASTAYLIYKARC